MRKGNENDDVFIFRYIAEGSFDSYSWQILETKQGFISQFLSGSTYQRENSDLEENVLTYAQVKAIALAQPLMKKRADLENKLHNLMILTSKNYEAEEQLNDELMELRQRLENQKNRIIGTKKNYEYVSEMVIDLSEYATDFVLPFEAKKICGFFFEEPEIQDDKKPYILATRLGISYMIRIGDKPSGNLSRVKNFFKNFDKQIINDQENLAIIENRINDICTHQSNTDYRQYVTEIQELRSEIEEVDRKIGLSMDENYIKMYHVEDDLYPNTQKIKKVYGGNNGCLTIS